MRSTTELTMTSKLLLATNPAMFKNVPTAVPAAAQAGTPWDRYRAG
jgi:hypothetical protein